MSSRSKHQFRPSTLEVFEDRITPTTVLLPGQTPFYPPGQGTASDIVPCTVLGTGGGVAFGHSGDTVFTTVTNNSGSPQVVTFALYTAPGGGENPNGNAYDNISSQKLATSVTFTAPTGRFVATAYSIDLSSLHLTGQQKFQAELFCGSFAPTKPTTADINGIIIGGVLGDYDDGDGVLQHGHGR